MSTARSAESSPPCDAVNHTSLPSGDHARPRSIESHPVARSTFFLLRSTIDTVPMSSANTGWSAKATCCPSGDTRDAADPAGRLVEHVAERQLDALAAADAAHDGELRPVGRPVRLTHVADERAWTGAEHRRARQRPLPHPPVEGVAERERELARAARRRASRRRERERCGLAAVRPREEHLRWITVPGGTIDHRLAVGREAGGADRSPAEREPRKYRLGDRQRDDRARARHHPACGGAGDEHCRPDHPPEQRGPAPRRRDHGIERRVRR